jgi:hypothetical protein
LLLLCNEEGQLQGLPPNVSLAQYGVLVGTIVVLGQDANDPDEFGSLSDEQVAWALRRFA